MNKPILPGIQIDNFNNMMHINLMIIESKNCNTNDFQIMITMTTANCDIFDVIEKINNSKVIVSESRHESANVLNGVGAII